MRLVSTRDATVSASFRDALFAGLAPDGGLFNPAVKLDFRDRLRRLPAGASFPETAAAVSDWLLADEFPAGGAARIARDALTFPIPLRRLEPGVWVLELFHGPSCAFKDVGASYLAAAMDASLAETGARAVVLVATSGDTGSAVARAFHGRARIDVVILYPSGRVSDLQEKQLTTLGGNVQALEITGSFDDCQRLVKAAFMDRELRATVPITSANSINVGRLFPQAFYYVHGHRAAAASGADRVVFSVPSGNFGNLTAGVLAWSWGLPVSAFLAATNINDVVPEYLERGEFVPRASVHTLANAMDVGNPSNFERLQAIFPSRDAMAAVIYGSVSTDEQMLATISDCRRRLGVFVDPHTACGIRAARTYLEGETHDAVEIVVVSTAHPAKFPETVHRACGEYPPVPRQLQGLSGLEKHSIVMEPQGTALRRFLLERYST